jgi:putative FmdB family regulatory protein
MPIYEYRCQACGEKFEKIVSLATKTEGLICPNCNAPATQKVFSTFSATGVTKSTGGCGGSGSFT